MKLSTKLLCLTVLFVLIAEILIYVPSLANYRVNWLNDRLTAGRTAALVLDAAPDGMLPAVVLNDLLASVGAEEIVLQAGHRRKTLAKMETPPMAEVSVDMRNESKWQSIFMAFNCLFNGDTRVMRVIGMPPRREEYVELLINETPLKEGMIAFSKNILGLSLLISLLTSSLVFLALHFIFVRPMRRLNKAMLLFRRLPENRTSIFSPSPRKDEIGQTEQELATMQLEIHNALKSKSRLAALGLAIAKINHDLRNLLTTAQLLSDRLMQINDPTAQKFVPKLLTALDRAVNLCSDTLTFGKAEEMPPQLSQLDLHELIEEVRVNCEENITFMNAVPPNFCVKADPEQLFRVLMNLARNACQAMPEGGTLTIASHETIQNIHIDIRDTGHGLSEKAKANIFTPFSGSTRLGGTGLGLAIAREIMQAHGGEIELLGSVTGAHFRLTLSR